MDGEAAHRRLSAHTPNQLAPEKAMVRTNTKTVCFLHDYAVSYPISHGIWSMGLCALLI